MINLGLIKSTIGWLLMAHLAMIAARMIFIGTA